MNPVRNNLNKNLGKNSGRVISYGMKVLMLSIDKKIFDEGSDVRNRMLEYGSLFDELHIVIFSKENNKSKISDNTFVYSTKSKSKFFYISDAAKIGKKIVNDSHGDFIITAQDPFETGLAGWLIAHKFKIKLQLQVHTDFLSKHFVQSSTLNKIRVIIAKFLLPRADCIRVVSNRIKNSIVSKFQIPNSKFYLLPIFVDIEKIKSIPITVDLHKKYPQFEKIVLMVSRLEKEKNIPLAIEAMREVIKKYPRTGLVIVGDGSEREALKTKVKRQKSKDDIVFEGWQNKDIVISYYKTADLFLVTSDYEGYGLTIIEALASGLSVLSTDIGIAREVGARITERDSIAEKIVKYIENSPKTAELANYPYKNKAEYLDKFKQSFTCVS